MSWSDLPGIDQTHTPTVEILFRFILAIVFGAMLGFEREVRERSAGLRTHMLVALAASMFTVLTFEIFHELRSLDGTANADPIRLVEAVTAGVSFLAAGTIIHGTGKVHGLTTGAGIWLAGALGIATGSGFYVIAVMGVGLALIIFVLLRLFERHLLETKKPPD